MQTKSALSLLVHNYRAVLQKCFWTNAMTRQDALKSLSSKVNRSAFVGLLLAAMSLVAAPAVADTISVDSNPVATGNTLSEVKDSLAGNTATLSDDVTQSEMITFEGDTTLTLESDTADTVRTITMDKNVVVGSGSFFAQTTEDKTLTLNFSDMKLTHGVGKTIQFEESESTPSVGGAIYSNGNVALTDSSNVEFFQNRSILGGAIYAEDTISISGTNKFSENVSLAVGGAIYANGDITISGTNNFSKNKTDLDNNNGGVGGAIYNLQGNISIDGENLFEENTSGNGGAIFTLGTVTLKGKNTFKSNKASSGLGGAIYSNGDINIDGKNSFEQNVSGNGGALYVYEGDITLSGENTFSSNEARNGGAIFTNVGNIEINGTNQFTSNKSTLGGGAIYAYGSIKLSGKNTFENNTITAPEEQLGSPYIVGGAISAGGDVLFTGDDSEATFTGNNIDGRPNDIYTTYGCVAFGDKGTYTFDGGIDTASQTSGYLIIGAKIDSTGPVSAPGTSVTFEKGAINRIAGRTRIGGKDTVVHFKNEGNYFVGGMSVESGAAVTFDEKAKIFQTFKVNDASLTLKGGIEILYGGISMAKLDLTNAKSITVSNLDITLANGIYGKTLTASTLANNSTIANALVNEGIVVVDCAEGDKTFKDFKTKVENGLKLSYDNGDIVLSMVTTEGDGNRVVDAFNSASAQGAAMRSVMNHNDMIGTALSNHIMSNIANNNHIGMIVLDETSMMASTSGVSAIAVQDESGAFSVWGEALYSYSEFNGSSEILGSRESSVGGLLGFEQTYSDVHYGLFVGAISSNIDGEDSADLESEAIYGGAYVGVHYGMFIANFGAMVGYTMNEASRLGISGEITGEYDSYMGNVFGEVGAYIELTERLYAQATVGLQYTYVNSEDYNEEGTLANHVDSNDFDSLNVSVDARLGYRMADGFIEARAGVAFELLETSINSHFNLLDNPAALFSAQGTELDSMKFILGVDAGYYLSDNVELRGGILGEVGDESERVTGNVRLIYTF